MRPLAVSEVFAKRILRAMDVTAGEERGRQMRSSGQSRLRLDCREELVAGQAGLGQRSANPAHARPTPVGLGVKRIPEGSRRRIDPKAENVNRLMPPGGRDLDAGNQRHPESTGRRAGIGESGSRIVIGKRQDADPSRGGFFDQLGRCQGAVRACGMRMQVDGAAGAHEGFPAKPTACRRPPDNTMKPCARSKPSLV